MPGPAGPSSQRFLTIENEKVRGSLDRPLRCASCGYEIVSYRSIPDCPMCGEFCWEPTPWRPFTRHRF